MVGPAEPLHLGYELLALCVPEFELADCGVVFCLDLDQGQVAAWGELLPGVEGRPVDLRGLAGAEHHD